MNLGIKKKKPSSFCQPDFQKKNVEIFKPIHEGL